MNYSPKKIGKKISAVGTWTAGIMTLLYLIAAVACGIALTAARVMTGAIVRVRVGIAAAHILDGSVSRIPAGVAGALVEA
jgi:hypothetical protein